MDFRLPELGEGVYEAELVGWLVRIGDTVKRGQNLLEVMTDKATMEVPSPFAGAITALHAEPGQQIKVGDVMLTFDPGATTGDMDAGAVRAEKKSAAKKKAALLEESPALAPAQSGNGPSNLLLSPSALQVKAAPSVRHMARKLGINLSELRGSGPQGRILIDDLSSALAVSETGKRLWTPEAPPDYGAPGTRIKLRGLRRKIAERMIHSARTIPHYTYVDECEVTDLVKVRDSLKETFQCSGLKLTYLAFFVKAVVRALKEIPVVNASLDEEAEEIVLHDRYNVGIAVATLGGLIVPVIHDADRLDLPHLARAIDRLSSDARAGKSKRDDLREGTFTITSIGNIGGLISTPVINHPEVGILGIGKISKRPVFDDAGTVRSADMVYLSFSFDHRVLDGAIGAAFANAVIKHLRNPAALLLPDKLG